MSKNNGKNACLGSHKGVSPTIGQKVVRTGLQRPILSMFRARP